MVAILAFFNGMHHWFAYNRPQLRHFKVFVMGVQAIIWRCGVCRDGQGDNCQPISEGLV